MIFSPLRPLRFPGVLGRPSAPPFPTPTWWLDYTEEKYTDAAGTTPVAVHLDPVRRWNDSLGGPVFANQAVLERSLTWNAQDNQIEANKDTATVRWLDLDPTNFTFNNQGYSIFFLGRPVLSWKPQRVCSFFFGRGLLQLCGITTTVSGGTTSQFMKLINQQVGYTFTGRNATPTLPTGPSVWGIVASPTQVKLVTNDHVTTIAAQNSPTPGPHNQGYIYGVPANDYPSFGRFKHVLFYNRAITDQEIADIQAQAAFRGMIVSSDVRVVFDGDSMTESPVPGEHSYVTFLERMFTAEDPTFRFKSYNVAVSGQFVQTCAADAPTFVDPHYDATKTNIAIIWAGTGDIALGGQTGAQTWNSMNNWLTGRNTTGFITVAIPMLPRSAATEAQRTAFNDLIFANPGAYDAVIPRDHAMFQAGANTNLTWYNADQLHLNNTGQEIMAGLVRTAIEPFM